MATFILAFIIFLLLVGGMAIGVILKRKPIKGSCGGMSALGMSGGCSCASSNRCDNQDKQDKQTSEVED